MSIVNIQDKSIYFKIQVGNKEETTEKAYRTAEVTYLFKVF